MYVKDRQMKLDDFIFPYGKLNHRNEWVKLADRIDWDWVEDHYAARFPGGGAVAHPARIALGSLIIKKTLRCSDAWVVRHISENPYLQYFLGMKSYTYKCPFAASTMSGFRKRFSEGDLAQVMATVTTKKKKSKAPRRKKAD